MAADDAWPQGRNLAGDTGGDRGARAVAQLRTVLRDVEARVASGAAPPLAPKAAAALGEALEALGRRLDASAVAAASRDVEIARSLARLCDQLEAETQRRHALEAQLAAGEARLSAALAAATAELRAMRAAAADPPRDPAPLRAVFWSASIAAMLSVMGAGAVLLAHPDRLPPVVARPLEQLARAPRDAILSGLPRLAFPLARPTPGPGAPTVATSGAALADDGYEAVVQALSRGDATALPRLTGLAEAGDVKAQLHLAGLYEAGAQGLPRDLAAARSWTRKAADGGDRVAMHNMGLFLANGDGGPPDPAGAAAWFRRAADRGVVDSQYNLGLMYQAGRGVPRNLREAYRWFSIAANAGDADARAQQVALEAKLTPAERADLDRQSQGFQPGPTVVPDTAIVIPPATTLAGTQALLARQGYYVGPMNGVPSPALKAAAGAYLRDHPDALRSRPSVQP